jgi:hypothetical protein
MQLRPPTIGLHPDFVIGQSPNAAKKQRQTRRLIFTRDFLQVTRESQTVADSRAHRAPANILANRDKICQPSRRVFFLAADTTGRRR